MLQLSGVVLAVFEVLLWLIISIKIRNSIPNLIKMNTFTYYWFTFIILTGFWEIVYLVNYKFIAEDLALNLVQSNTHVWTNKYDFTCIFPWKFSELFYAEYGAWADREYMSQKDIWSHLIEGSHCLFCSLFCIWALFAAVLEGVNSKHFSVALAFAMGCQFMNSFLYMSEYGIQCNDPESVNYFNTTGFPLGKDGIERPFMYVNLLWTICPIIISLIHLVFESKENVSVNVNQMFSKKAFLY